MHATSKLRALRPLKPRDQQTNSASSSDMHMASRPNATTSKRTHHNGSSADSSTSNDSVGATVPRRWRRNSSAEIPIPSFMIPCSASTLMNSLYALASPTETSASASSFAPRTNYPTAIQQR